MGRSIKRPCVIPGCPRFVVSRQHWLCPACYETYGKGERPPWLRALIQHADHEQHRERIRQQKEICFSDLSLAQLQQLELIA